jgi:1-acyl-sn-glycerol-3-phosphate acyltransferase
VRATIVGRLQRVNAPACIVPERSDDGVRVDSRDGGWLSWTTRRGPLIYALKLLGIAINTALLAPAIAVAAAWDARRAYDLSRLWAHLNLVLTGVRVHGTRQAPLDPERPYVFMSNHASHFDALAVVEALPEFQLRWVAKRELANIPIFGWALRRAGHIIIDRSNADQALASLRAARAMMETGISVMIFPEGTREGHDNELLPLKKGGFVLALETGAAIVPVAVRDSRAILPRDDWRVRSGTMEVVVGEPIPVAGETRESLVRKVEAFLRRELDLDEPAPRTAEAR